MKFRLSKIVKDCVKYKLNAARGAYKVQTAANTANSALNVVNLASIASCGVVFESNLSFGQLVLYINAHGMKMPIFAFLRINISK
jgi:hypothetical protein